MTRNTTYDCCINCQRRKPACSTSCEEHALRRILIIIDEGLYQKSHKLSCELNSIAINNISRKKKSIFHGKRTRYAIGQR